MTDSLLASVAVPLATREDAETTGRALARVLPAGARVTAIHVIEKAGGAPDKAPMEGREADAADIFESFEAELAVDGIDTRTVYSTDVVEGILDAAAEVGANAIVFVPRGGSRLVQYLAGDVALDLLESADCPVVGLPEPDGGGDTVESDR